MVGVRAGVVLLALVVAAVPVSAERVYVLVNVPGTFSLEDDWAKVFITAASLARSNGPSVVPVPVQGPLGPLELRLLNEPSRVLTYGVSAVRPGWERLPDTVEEACARVVNAAREAGVRVDFLLCLDRANVLPALELAPVVAKQCGAIVWGDPTVYLRSVPGVPVLTLDEYLRRFSGAKVSVRAVAAATPPCPGNPKPMALAAVLFACLRPAVLGLVSPSSDPSKVVGEVRGRLRSVYGVDVDSRDVRYLVVFGAEFAELKPPRGLVVAAFPFRGVPGFLAACRMILAGLTDGEPCPVLLYDPRSRWVRYEPRLRECVQVSVLRVSDVAALNVGLASHPCAVVDASEVATAPAGQGAQPSQAQQQGQQGRTGGQAQSRQAQQTGQQQPAQPGGQAPAPGAPSGPTSWLGALDSQGRCALFLAASPNVIRQAQSFATPNGYPKFSSVAAFVSPVGALLAYLFAAAGYELGEAVQWASWVLEVLRERGCGEGGLANPAYVLIGDPFRRFRAVLEYPLPGLKPGSVAVSVSPAFLVPFGRYWLLPLVLPGFVAGLWEIPRDNDWMVVAEGLDFVRFRLGSREFSVSAILAAPAGVRSSYALPLNEFNKYRVTVVVGLVPRSERARPAWVGVSACGVVVGLALLLAVSGAMRGRVRSSRTWRCRTSRALWRGRVWGRTRVTR